MVDAAMLKHQTQAPAELPPQSVSKWDILRELAAAREAFGLSDRDLTVLQALISFHPETMLGGAGRDLIVFPSNAAICERLNGMPSSTMRRHLGHLVQARILLRRDSPNGKRYARRYGSEKVAFGFDLSPLVRRYDEFCAAAQAAREAQQRLRQRREMVSLMRRDLAALAVYGGQARPELEVWDAFADMAILTARALRRKLDLGTLAQLETELRKALDEARTILDATATENMSTSESRSEQHYQSSNKDCFESEPNVETAESGEDTLAEPGQGAQASPPDRKPNIPLGLILESCKEYLTYSERPVRCWRDLVRIADYIRPMMGISPATWDAAKTRMGPEQAAVVIVAMLERFQHIRSPGGYLTSLSAKAAQGVFSCGPMIMALSRRQAA